MTIDTKLKIMQNIFLVLIGCLILLGLYIIFAPESENDSLEIDTYIKQSLCGLIERAYFLGQKDYAQGKVLIKKVNDSTYIWAQSPWGDSTQPIYNPGKK